MTLYENEMVPYPPYNISDSWNNLTKRLGFEDQNQGRIGYRQRLDTMQKYQATIKNYYRLISEVDAACKAIVDELDRQELFNSTIIIVTADNGFMLGEHGMSGKWFPFEESIRVPLIVYDPRMPRRKVGTVDDSFTLNVDLAQTILGAAGIHNVPSTMQVRDIADLYLTDNSSTWRSEFYYEHLLQLFGEKRIRMSSALVRKDYKLFRRRISNLTTQLFDLTRDPHELHDVSSEQLVRVKEMAKRHDELAQSVL
jgi:arylsulfatase A-like enzyme